MIIPLTRRGLFALLMLVTASGALRSQDYILTRIAGAGPQTGDGGPAMKARFTSASAIAYGPDGSLYVADSGSHAVRRVQPNGIIVSFAGNGAQGGQGDGGPATSAQLDKPTALAVGRAGQLYIGDSGTHTIREVTANGIITTLAGNGQAASYKTPMPSTPSPSTSQPLNMPVGIALLPNGDLVIADAGAAVVVQVAVQQKTIARIAGGGSGNVTLFDQVAVGATLAAVAGVATDPQGNIYVCEGVMVRRIGPDGTLIRVLGTGTASESSLSAPELSFGLNYASALAVAPNGIGYVNVPGGIVRWDMAAHTAAQVAGKPSNLPCSPDSVPAQDASIAPTSVALDQSNNLVFGDACPGGQAFNDLYSSRVRKITGGNTMTTIAGGYLPAGRGDGGPATAAELYLPERMAVGKNGELYIADTGDFRVRRVNPDGTIDTFAGTGQDGNLQDHVPATQSSMRPDAVAVDPITGLVYVASHIYYQQYYTGSKIAVIDGKGVVSTITGTGSDFSGSWTPQSNVPAVSAGLSFVLGMATDSQGNLFVSDSASGRVFKISAGTLTISTVVGAGSQTTDGGPAFNSSLGLNGALYPVGLNVSKGDQLYITDPWLHSIRRVNGNGTISTVAGGGSSTADGVPARSAQLALPTGVAVDSKGNVFIADAGRVDMIDASTGNIRRIAGGLSGFGVGENGPALLASLTDPRDVQVDGSDNVYVVDHGNHAVYKLSLAVAAVPPAISAIENEASLANTPIAAPGERVEVLGTSLQAGQIYFDEFAARVLSASPLVVQVPYEVAGRSGVQVTAAAKDGSLSAAFPLQIVDATPAVYLRSPATGEADAANSDGTTNNSANPAAGGSTLSFSVTGAGLLDENGAPLAAVSVEIAGMDAPVLSAVESPDAPGKVLLQVTVPYGLDPTQPAPLVVSAGVAESQQGVVVWAGDASAPGTRSKRSPLPPHLSNEAKGAQ